MEAEENATSDPLGAYFFYSPETSDFGRIFPRNSENAQNEWVASNRSSSVKLAPIQTKKGNATYRVTGTIGGKQRKRQFSNLADAEAQRDVWELERISAAAAMRPKITRLTQSELVDAESCIGLLKGSGFTLIEATRYILRNPPLAQCELTFDTAYKQFLEARKPYISTAQYGNYEGPCRRLSVFFGPKMRLVDITTHAVEKWLTSLGVSSKSWNNYRGDLAVVFHWFISPPQKWLIENPITALPRFRKRDTLPGSIEVLTHTTAREMLHWLEINKPHWVACFALAIFAGVRPDRRGGEMSKLATAIERDGINKYFRGDSLHLTKKITKDGRDRRIPLPENLKEWLRQYPATPEALRGGNRAEYAEIRKKWNIAHDGLRHTSISACAALHSITEAAVRHGNSEKVCRDNYVNLFSVPDAQAFFAIRPLASAAVRIAS